MLKRWKLVSGFAAAALVASGVAAAAQTLIVARGNDANSLDPAESTSFEAIKMADWAFDGLVRFDGNSHDIVPALAESWEISEDGLTWTFKLREDVKFHDGTPMNAEAVEFSLERQRDTEHPFYCKDCLRWSAKFDSIEKTTAIDEYTVEIKLKEPSPALLVNLAFYIGYIVSPTAVKEDPEGFRSNPVGTGPFKFVRWERDNFTEYTANEDYYLGAPKVDRLIVRVIPNNDVRFLALKKGEVQLIYGVPFPQFDEVDSDPNLKLLTSSTLGISMMAMNTEKAPFDNPKVREAVELAINKDRMFNTVFFGRGEIANQVIPSNWWGHSDKVEDVEYDVEKAKELMAEAGYEDGFKTTLISWTNPRPYLPAPRDAVSLIKSDLAQIGIDVDVQTMNWSTFREMRGKGDYGMSMGGWISGTLDPDGIIYALFHSRYIREQDALNWARYKDEEVDSLLDEARGIYDQDERAALYEKAAEKIVDSNVAVFFAHPITAIAARSNLENVFIHDSNWVPLHEVELKE